MTIEQFCNKLEIFLYSEIVADMKDGSGGGDNLFFEWNWDSDTYWVKLGLPDEWFQEEDPNDKG